MIKQFSKLQYMMVSDKHQIRGAKTNGNSEIGIIWVKR